MPVIFPPRESWWVTLSPPAGHGFFFLELPNEVFFFFLLPSRADYVMLSLFTFPGTKAVRQLEPLLSL